MHCIFIPIVVLLIARLYYINRIKKTDSDPLEDHYNKL